MRHRAFLLLSLIGVSLGCAHGNSAPAAPQVAAPKMSSTSSDVGGSTMRSAKEECEDLMNSVLPFAHKILTQHREFYPFGGAMAPDGKIIAVGGDPGEEHPGSQEVIDLLERGFQEGARTGKYKATAVVVDMRVVPPGKNTKQDAIAVRLDHRDGYSAVVVFPYSIGSSGEVTIAAPFAVKGAERIFAR